jgi:RNA-directed DNA polymerase
MREIMGKLRLRVNEEKTRICKVPDGAFDRQQPLLRHHSGRHGEGRQQTYFC